MDGAVEVDDGVALGGPSQIKMASNMGVCMGIGKIQGIAVAVQDHVQFLKQMVTLGWVNNCSINLQMQSMKYCRIDGLGIVERLPTICWIFFFIA